MAKKPKKLLFTLILIGLLSQGPSCYRQAEVGEDDGDAAADTESGSSADADADADGDGDTDGDTDGDADTDADADGDTDGDSDGDADGDTDADADSDSDGFCDEDWEEPETRDVPSFEEKVAATKDAICSAGSAVIESNRAATLTLDPTGQDFYRGVGTLEFADNLAMEIAGLPRIDFTDTTPNDLATAIIAVSEQPDGSFAYTVDFPHSAEFEPGYTEITVRVTFDIACDTSGEGEAPQLVVAEAWSYLHLCDSEKGPVWVASGDTCTICQEMFEPVARPLPPASNTSLAALSRSPELEIVPLARFGRSVVLAVEHRGTRGAFSVNWRASGGTLAGADKSCVLWEMPTGAGPHLIQVAVSDESSASVTSLRLDHLA